MNKTFEDYIARYEKKTQEKFERNEDLNIYFLPDKGFCEIGVKENKIVIGAMSGDGKFWREFADEIARRMGLKIVAAYWIRKSPTAYIRLFGFHVVKETETVKGAKDYLCVNEKGKYLTAVPAYKNNFGRDVYRVIWEV